MAGFPHRQPERYLRPMLPERTHIRALCAPLLLALAGACGGEVAPDPAPEPGSAPAIAEPSSDVLERSHERSLVFLAQGADSSVVIPTSFRTSVRGATTTREASAWMGLNGAWELMALDSAVNETLPSPFRTLPTRRIRIVVGEEDALEAVLVRDSLYRADLHAEMALESWVGTTGEALTLRRAAAILDEEELTGVLLDLSLLEPGSRDWILLESGDDFQSVLIQDPDGGGTPGYQGWGRVAVRDVRWPEMTVEWDELRAFEQARRDIPARWIITTPGGELSGTLESIGAHLSAGEGEGPLLPVSAWFQVRGEMEVEGEVFDVTGVIRHRQH